MNAGSSIERRERALADVRSERIRQDVTWGADRGLDVPWLGVLVEEVGEAATETSEGTTAALRKELVQVAAVAVAWIEALDRAAPNAREVTA